MSDQNGDRDGTEPVCAPLIRIETTMHAVSDSPNGTQYIEHGETEPCAMNPLISIEAELKPVKNADKPPK